VPGYIYSVSRSRRRIKRCAALQTIDGPSAFSRKKERKKERKKGEKIRAS
jgi:hypothetical protein